MRPLFLLVLLVAGCWRGPSPAEEKARQLRVCRALATDQKRPPKHTEEHLVRTCLVNHYAWNHDSTLIAVPDRVAQ